MTLHLRPCASDPLWQNLLRLLLLGLGGLVILAVTALACTAPFWLAMLACQRTHCG